MTERTKKLRQQSLDARPTISPERARLITDFYRANLGKLSAPRHAGPSLPASVPVKDDLHRRG